MLETLRSVVRRPSRHDRPPRPLRGMASVGDLRAAARRRLPGGVFDYIDGGADDELTLRANEEAFARRCFVPRVLTDVSAVDAGGRLLGHRLPLPLVLAPTGFTRIAHPQGEMAVARAAARAGLPYTLSTLGTTSIEDVASAGGPRWFQVYAWRDRGLVRDMIDRARDAGYHALVLTVDTAVLGHRERDSRRGFTLPPTIGLRTFLDGARHPGWTSAFVRSEPIRFANVRNREVGDGSTPVRLADYIGSQFDPALGWGDVEWIRSVWDGPVVVKGIQSVADAELAVSSGVEAVALSNHGGRQLDRAPAALELVAPVRDAVGDGIDVLCDGGVRRGSDIVMAAALGASGCMIGRAYLYGLAVAGEAGVTHVLDLLTADVHRTLALLGVASLSDLTRDAVDHGSSS
ncbi:MAG TPA: alpha-hydroxy acid oxidase [Iamia sp.]